MPPTTPQSPQPAAPRFIGVQEFSRNVELSRSTIYACLNDGRILSVRFGQRRLIPADEQARFTEELLTQVD